MSTTAQEPIPIDQSAPTSGRDRVLLTLGRVFGSDLFVLLLTVLVVLIALPFTNGFLSPGNLTNIASNYWPLLLVVIGQTFVLITAGIDLSQTATLALTNVVGAMLVTQAANPALFSKSPLWNVFFGQGGGALGSGPFSVVLTWLIMVLVGALVGALNGFAVARIKMPPFMVTLASMLFFTAFAVWSTKSENISNLPPTFVSLSNGLVAGVVGLLGAAVGHLILSRTLLGHWLYAIGTNAQTSRVSGVPTERVLVCAYMLSGSFAAVGAALYSARLGAGRPTLGANLLMDVIGAAVIGGVSLMGGRGRITGAALGVLFFVVLTNVLNLMGLEFYTIMWIKGLIIVAAVAIDSIRMRREGGRA